MILVTGGCGFIGSNLVMKLLARGARVRILDNLVSGNESPVPESSVDFVKGDVRDSAAVKRALAGVSSVVHLAASGSVIDSIHDPRANFDVNVSGTLNVLQACVGTRVDSFIFASTGGAAIGEYGGRVDEDVVPRPISPYGAGKVAGEVYCHAFSSAFGLRTISLRFANVYGPHSGHKRSAITNFLRAVKEGTPIKVFGDGFATRDFLYVDDLCDGILLALASSVEPMLFHLASGIETTVNDLIQVILSVAGRPDHPVVRLPPRVGEVRNNVASFALAKKRLGFSPKLTLNEGIAKTWEWIRDSCH